MTEKEDRAEIYALERRHGKRFLQMALHADAIRWRELTAPNRACWRAKDSAHPSQERQNHGDGNAP